MMDLPSLSVNNQCLRHINRLNSLEMISTNMLQIQSRCISITRNAIQLLGSISSPANKSRSGEYEYMVIPNIAVSVIISVSVAHTISIHFGLIYVIMYA